MKRDWDLIRDVLLEVEEIPRAELYHNGYDVRQEDDELDLCKAEQAIILWDAGFLKGMNASSMEGRALMAPELTWEGHDLLDTLRSKPVWERVKAVANEKGIELTFDSVKALAGMALAWVVQQ